MTQEIMDFFKLNDVKYKENFRLAQISPIKIGGLTKFVVYPDDHKKLIKIVKFLKNKKIKHKILGRMSNVLPPDDEYNGVIVRSDCLSNFDIKGTFVDASAGVSLPLLAKTCADLGLSGFEELSGIPGSVGGAIRGNAGAYGREIGDLVSRVTVYNSRTQSVEYIKADKISFGYRLSSFSKGEYIILCVRFSLSRSDKFSANKLIQLYREKRTATQPVGLPSLGSVFKRPSKNLSAAKLIDDCGLKGVKIGGTKISEKHAGFIVNVGGATAGDYLKLSEYVKDKVFQNRGILLEREIEVM